MSFVLTNSIKRTLSPKLTPAFCESMKTLGAGKVFFIIPGGDRFSLSTTVDVIGLHDFLRIPSEQMFTAS